MELSGYQVIGGDSGRDVRYDLNTFVERGHNSRLILKALGDRLKKRAWNVGENPLTGRYLTEKEGGKGVSKRLGSEGVEDVSKKEMDCEKDSGGDAEVESDRVGNMEPEQNTESAYEEETEPETETEEDAEIETETESESDKAPEEEDSKSEEEASGSQKANIVVSEIGRYWEIQLAQKEVD